VPKRHYTFGDAAGWPGVGRTTHVWSPQVPRNGGGGIVVVTVGDDRCYRMNGTVIVRRN